MFFNDNKFEEINISAGKENYSQRNNEISPTTSCGPTNMIQALDYSGWEVNRLDLFQELKQPEDKLMKFCRTDYRVESYYEKSYPIYYKNWKIESEKIAKETGKEPWEVECKDSYPPNEIHEVMSYATNLYIGSRVTCFRDNGTVEELLNSLFKGVPVVSSVSFNGGGHYVTIVGFTIRKDKIDKCKNAKSNEIYDMIEKGEIKDFIIDNTYGVFNFKDKCYDKTSGNDEHIDAKQFMSMVKPLNSKNIIMHSFIRAPSSL